MTPNPITIRRELLAVGALKIMETHKITSVIVTDVSGRTADATGAPTTNVANPGSLLEFTFAGT